MNIPEKYLKLLDVTWAKPSVLSNWVLQKIPLNKFKYSEKIDGFHTYILIFDKQVYNVTDNKDPSKIYQIDESTLKDFNFSGDCILETEYYNNTYFIFDVYYINEVDYSSKFLDERLNSINEYLEELGPSFKVKKFYEIQSLDELLEYIKKDKSPEGIDIDGIILQRVDKPYFQEKNESNSQEKNEPNSYKFKPLHLNTVDFLLKYDLRERRYNLYLLGSYLYDFRNNLKLLPKDKDIYGTRNINNPINLRKNTPYNNEKVLIYFDSPFYPNLGTMKLTQNWNMLDYTSSQIEKINRLINKMRDNPTKYHNSIVELSLTNDKKWVPLRLREDKILPNSYKVGLSTISIIFDQIKPSKDIYFQKNLTTSQEKLDIIHKINKVFRKFITEKYAAKFDINSSVIDLCGGRGADEYNLYSNGVANFFVIDNDTTALKRYCDRTLYINKKEKYEPLTTNNNCKPNWININILKHKLDKNYNDIKKDLNSRYEFYRRKVNIVLMNYAIHYLCDDEEKITKLSEFVNSVIYNDGIFIVAYFDGDEIIQRKNNKISKIGPFDIEIIKEDKGVTIAKMPLPTIKEGENIYAEEPLVKQEMINKLETHLKKIEDFYVYDECKKYIDVIPGFEEYIDYYKLIKVGIYGKKC